MKDITDFYLINTEIPPEEIGKKYCRLDINMEIDGRRVNLEIQVKDDGDFPERALYYWAREYSTALSSSEKYIELPETISINILGFNLFNDSVDYHSEFQVLEVTRHERLTEKFSLHFCELDKLHKIEQIDPNEERELWLALFNAKTEEDLNKIISKGGRLMTQAVKAYRRITADEHFRYLERLREDARHIEAQALYHAREQGMEQGIELGIQQERERWQEEREQFLREIEELRANNKDDNVQSGEEEI